MKQFSPKISIGQVYEEKRSFAAAAKTEKSGQAKRPAAHTKKLHYLFVLLLPLSANS